MNINYWEIGSRIRTARQYRHMTAEKLAEEIGIASESLRHIENASSNPSLNTLFRIAYALEVSMDYLTGRIPDLAENLTREYGITKEQELTLREIVTQLIPIITKRV